MNFFKLSKFLLFIPVLAVALVSTSTLFPFIVGKYVVFRTAVDLSLISFCVALLMSNDTKKMYARIKSVVRHPIYIAVGIFTLAFTLACLFGVDPAFSFWSNFERGEGGIQILHFFAYFSLLLFHFDKEADWKKFFGWILIGGIASIVYGFLAGVGTPGFVGEKFSSAGARFQGSIGNPAYVAGYCMFLLFYTLYLLSSGGKKILKSFRGISLLIFIVVLLVVFALAATRGAFLGLVIAIGAFLLCLAITNKKWRVKSIVAILIVGATFTAGVYFKNSRVIKALPFSRIFDISFSAETFEDRAIMWQMAWDGFKARPIFGWGPENFTTVFDTHFNTAYFNPPEGFGAWFDRAHSVIFDYLSETGIVGLLSYFCTFVVVFWMIIKNLLQKRGSEDNKITAIERALLVAVIVSYLVQALVLFDVYVTYLNLFIILAFSAYKLKSVPKMGKP